MRQPRFRRARRQALNAQGIESTKTQRAFCIRVVDTTILPAWLKDRLIPGLGSVTGVYWLKRKDAFALMAFFRTIAVWYTVTEQEFKRCARCFRPLIGTEATGIRKAMETVKDRTVLVCGPNCDKENESGVWRTLGEKVAA
jgi:hypothetical protein